jgi:hypothetical protein
VALRARDLRSLPKQQVVATAAGQCARARKASREDSLDSRACRLSPRRARIPGSPAAWKELLIWVTAAATREPTAGEAKKLHRLGDDRVVAALETAGGGTIEIAARAEQRAPGAVRRDERAARRADGRDGEPRPTAGNGRRACRLAAVKRPKDVPFGDERTIYAAADYATPTAARNEATRIRTGL